MHRLSADADLHLSAVLAEALASLLDATGAGLLLLESSFENKEAAARLAVATGAGVVTDADTLSLVDGRFVAAKTVFAGTWNTSCAITAPLAIVTVKPNSVVVSTVAPVAPIVSEHAVTVSDKARRVALVERTVRPESGRPDLSSAAVVVAGGRGTEGDFSLVEELADVIGGAVGATRVATDEGWIGHDAQIGQTGVTIAPKLYVGVGVSGAVHHRGGMQASGTIVADQLRPRRPDLRDRRLRRRRRPVHRPPAGRRGDPPPQGLTRATRDWSARSPYRRLPICSTVRTPGGYGTDHSGWPVEIA